MAWLRRRAGAEGVSLTLPVLWQRTALP
jgi:hypothetical protein